MFENIIGNEKNKEILINDVLTGHIAHSYIFSGIVGIGKFMFAKEFAKSILCLNNIDKPCNNCKSCESFNNSNHPDITILDEEENTIKTEQIRTLIKDVTEKPIRSNKKIYIINNSENMTKEAQNCLLKTLEEPPEYVVIILVTGNENLLLNTIKSRCIKISFNGLNINQMKQYFNKNGKDITDNLYEASEGSLSLALKVKEKEVLYNKLEEKLKDIENLNELEILKLKDDILQEKEDITLLLDCMNAIFYNKIIEKNEYANKYINVIEFIENTKLRLKGNGNYDMTIDNLLLAMSREFIQS